MPGIGKVLKFKDPKGTTIELFSEWNYLGKHHQVIGVGPFKLGHVAFIVDDAKKITEFYTQGAGLPRFRLGRGLLRRSCAAAPTTTR